MAYLFEPEPGKPFPLEDKLGDDYADWLNSSELSQLLYWEVRNIGGGRVDILLVFGSYRFVAEMKRETDDASRDGLGAYLGQAGLYQGSNVALGFLIVLDLTDKSAGVPRFDSNAWVSIIPALTEGDLSRYIVVVRVPGNRKNPSTMTREAVKRRSRGRGKAAPA